MKKFLASVGNAQLLGKVNGEFKHIADVKTLTESTLSFSNTMEEVRAGEGGKLYGRFAHDAGMTVSLTEAMFDINYIALQVGATLEGDTTAYETEEDVVANGKITLKKTPSSIGNSCGLDKVVVWVKKKGCGADDAWIATVLETASTEVEVPTAVKATEGETLCVKYFTVKPEATLVAVSANFVPAELVLLLTTKLYAGDANAPETGKPVGEITVKVPRFQLDGSVDLSMAMSSAATISLNGTALAVSDGTCEDKGVYAEIVEVAYNSDFTTGLLEIAADEEFAKVGETPVVYGVYADGHMSTLDNTDHLVFEPVLSDGKYVGEPDTHKQKISVKDHPEMELNIALAAN